MKRAYEVDYDLIKDEVPKVVQGEETWEEIFKVEEFEWQRVKTLWDSRVPGSRAKERVMVAGVASMYHMGYNVSKMEELLEKGLQALESENRVVLSEITSELFYQINNVVKDETHTYWQYQEYNDFSQYQLKVLEKIEDYPNFVDETGCFQEKIYAGWLGQLIGGALGTQLEGYTAENIRKAFPDINDYLKTPSTYNDDITYEIAFLEAFSDKGNELSSFDIAQKWVGLIPAGWSAEEIALQNLRLGIYPPESGIRSNPFREWIGAQMRGAVCGMVAPGNPKLAARLAYLDAQISHANNGIMGEVFNAVMVSLAFVRNKTKDILNEAMEFIPADCEYYQVVSEALEVAKEADNYQEAYQKIITKYRYYNWIHAYPNAVIEVLALYFSEENFEETLLSVIYMGLDADCNAAQVMTILGIVVGQSAIADKWQVPLGDDLVTYVRGYERYSVSLLSKKTAELAEKAGNWKRA